MRSIVIAHRSRKVVATDRPSTLLGNPLNEPPTDAANRSAGTPMVGGVRPDDGRGIPTESQEFFVEKPGQAVDSGRDERACQLRLWVRTPGGLISELDGVFQRGGQGSVRFEVAEVVRRAVLSEVVADLDYGGGKSGEDIRGNAVDPQGGLRSARLAQSRVLQRQDASAGKGRLDLENPGHGGREKHEAEQ